MESQFLYDHEELAAVAIMKHNGPEESGTISIYVTNMKRPDGEQVEIFRLDANGTWEKN